MFHKERAHLSHNQLFKFVCSAFFHVVCLNLFNAGTEPATCLNLVSTGMTNQIYKLPTNTFRSTLHLAGIAFKVVRMGHGPC